MLPTSKLRHGLARIRAALPAVALLARTAVGNPLSAVPSEKLVDVDNRFLVSSNLDTERELEVQNEIPA